MEIYIYTNYEVPVVMMRCSHFIIIDFVIIEFLKWWPVCLAKWVCATFNIMQLSLSLLTLLCMYYHIRPNFRGT